MYGQRAVVDYDDLLGDTVIDYRSCVARARIYEYLLSIYSLRGVQQLFQVLLARQSCEKGVVCPAPVTESEVPSLGVYHLAERRVDVVEVLSLGFVQFVLKMMVPTRGRVPQRIAEDVGVAVPRLEVADAGVDGVGGDEAGEGGVVVAGVVVVEAGGAVEALAGVETAGIVGDDGRGAEVVLLKVAHVGVIVRAIWRVVSCLGGEREARMVGGLRPRWRCAEGTEARGRTTRLERRSGETPSRWDRRA
jgi:hypothetical protein